VGELIAKRPLGLDPVRHGDVVLAEVDLGRVTSVAPFKGADVARVLRPLVFPAPGVVSGKGAARLVWTGRGQAFLFGAVPEGLGAVAALTDQSDGWAGLSVTGGGVCDVLARLVPIDLRKLVSGQCARTMLGHMPLILIAIVGGFELLVFRSMAKTAWHEVEDAMKICAARATC
jgi:heterotetrameric sarcosine oxidase gamma subunit